METGKQDLDWSGEILTIVRPNWETSGQLRPQICMPLYKLESWKRHGSPVAAEELAILQT